MFEAGFFTVLSLYVLLLIKFNEWTDISALGFPMEAPIVFIKKVHVYENTGIILFIGAGVLAFTMSIPWYMGIGILLAACKVGGYIGRKRAFKMFREMHEEMHKEMIEHAETDSEKLRYHQESAKKTDQELKQMVTVSMEWKEKGY